MHEVLVVIASWVSGAIIGAMIMAACSAARD
jgi:hypothetical protein